jgi:DNA repair exonuclease SbcCD ATPase subunit
MQVKLIDIVDFYRNFPEFIGEIEVLTRFGFYQIEAAKMTAKDSEVYSITTENNNILCSPKHHLLSNGTWKFVEDLKIGDLLEGKAGNELITNIVKLEKRKDLYDLQVKEVHEFYANNIVSHNSLILDAVCYSLFNKPFRNINKPQLINSINGKELYVEVEFTTNNIHYRIIRGMKPNIFEIYCNGELILQEAANKDYQEILEKQILKMNFKTFTQVIIVGSANFSKFMELPAGQRREIIDDFLDIKILGDMMKVLKIEISDNKARLSDINNEINLHKEKITLKEKFIAQAEANKSNQISVIDSKLDILQSDRNVKLESLESSLVEIENLTKETAKYEIISKTITKMNMFEDKFKKTISDISKKINQYNEIESCPTCEQDICDNHREKLISVNKSKQEEQEIVLQELLGKIVSAEKELKEVKDKQKILNEKNRSVNSIRSDIASIESMIKELTNQKQKLQSDNQDNIQAEKDSLKLEAESVLQLIEEKKLLLEERNVQEAVSSLLKDQGIKTSIVRKYLPVLNSLINKYLAELDFFVSFEFNEQFEETIKSRHRDNFGYSSFSEGEKMRIDLAILFSWRELIKQKNSIDTNLLILDEIMDSSIDSEGISLFNNIIYGSSMLGNNIFLISHRSEWSDKFPNNIMLEKRNNFTVMKD